MPATVPGLSYSPPKAVWALFFHACRDTSFVPAARTLIETDMLKRTQNRIAESRFALPVVAVYGALVCILAGVVSQGWWIQALLLAISTLMMVILNNSNALIRIYSRMVSCSFLVMATMATFLLPSIESAVIRLCFIVFFLFLFKAYQDKMATGWIFYAFLSLGIGSLVFVQSLFFVPVMWILMATNIMAFSVRTFFASLVGIMTPYWFLLAFDVYMGQTDQFLNHFTALAQWGETFNFTAIDTHRLLTLIVVVLFSAIGTVHFLRNSFRDKIRIRMIYESFIVLELCIIIFLALQPQFFDPLLSMLIVITSTLIGHYISLTHTRWTNYSFFVIVALALLTTAYNLWIP
jgi:hypothetical protein